MAGVTLIGILAALYQYRVAKLLEIERTRICIARDLHDEVGSTLSSISYFAQAIRNEADARHLNGSEKFLSLIYEQALALMDGDETAQREALKIFEQLDATPAAEIVRHRLRRQGIRGPQRKRIPPVSPSGRLKY